MHRVSRSGRSLIAMSLTLALIAALGAGFMLRTATAQDATGKSHPAHLHTGTCDAPGDVVYPLSHVGSEYLVDEVPSAGDAVGPDSAVPVVSSQTTVQAALADIVAGGHILVVHESDEAIQNYIACGDVGGVMMGDSDLAFGLSQLNNSGYGGVAWLRDNGYGATLVTIFLMHLGEPAATDQGATETSAPAAVTIEGFAFNPQTIEVAVGDTVTWTNNDSTQHTVTQSPAGSGFQSDPLGEGATFSNTFDEAGTFEYFCEFHANMTGTVVVS